MQLIRFEDFIRRYYSGESFVIFDTETGGLNTYHDDIIEIGAMIWQKGEPIKTFQKLMKVNINKINPAAWEVHKIPKEEILAAPEPQVILQEFVDFCDGRPLLAHNIKFDFDMLNSNLIRNNLKPYSNDQVVCSLAYAKEQGKPGRLSELAKFYQIKTESNNLHRALYDVEVLKNVMDKVVKEHEPAEMQYSLIF